MSSRMVPRLALRQSRWAIQRRAASSTSEAASQGAAKAKETTQEVASKAQQGLSRVSSSAGSSLGKAGSAVGNTLSGIGGRTGQLIGFVNSLVPPTVYYAKVVSELGKIIVQGRGMYPPTMQTIQSYATPLQNALRNPSSLVQRSQQVAQSAGQTAGNTASQAVNNPESFLTRLRNMDTATLTTVGVVTAEVIGFFSIGEMIGRFKIIGYRTSGDAHGGH